MAKTDRRPATASPWARLPNTLGWATAVLLGGMGLLAGLPGAPAHAATVAAVFPPWWTQAEVWQAAGSAGDVVRVGASPFVLVMRSNAGDLEPRLRRAGALLVLDPGRLGPCGQPPSKESQS